MRIRKVNSVDVKLHNLTKVKLKTAGNTSVAQFTAGNNKTCTVRNLSKDTWHLFLMMVMLSHCIIHNREAFPKNWSDSKIKEAGNYVTNLPDNKNLPDGVIGYGEYDGVRVGIIKTDGKIGTIFPDADLQP